MKTMVREGQNFVKVWGNGIHTEHSGPAAITFVPKGEYDQVCAECDRLRELVREALPSFKGEWQSRAAKHSWAKRARAVLGKPPNAA